jgi:putative flippase GtrA
MNLIRYLISIIDYKRVSHEIKYDSSFIAIKQFNLFIFVGVISGIIDNVVMITLKEYFSLDPVYASLFGFSIGSIISYVTNRNFTFESARPHIESTWRFYAVNTIGFLITWIMMDLFVHHFYVEYIYARLLTMTINALVNFYLYKHWAFTKNSKSSRNNKF